MATRVREIERVELDCEFCRTRFYLTVRADRDRRRDGREPVCRDCRLVPLPVVTDDLVSWWRTIFPTPEDALPLAELIFGPRELWAPGEIAIRVLVEEAAVGGFTEDDFREMMSA